MFENYKNIKVKREYIVINLKVIVGTLYAYMYRICQANCRTLNETFKRYEHYFYFQPNPYNYFNYIICII